MEHYLEPKNAGVPDDFDLSAEELNPLCGDKVGLYFQIKDEVIVGVGHSTEGCAIAISSASIMTEKLKGLTLEEAKEYNLDKLLKELGTNLTASRRQCAMVVIRAMRKALNSKHIVK